MKAKYYRIRDYLYGDEAVDYLGALTGVFLDELDFFSILNSPLPVYISPLDEMPLKAKLRGDSVSVIPVGLQNLRSSFHFFTRDRLGCQINPPKSLLDQVNSYYVDLEGVISVDGWFDKDTHSWLVGPKDKNKWSIELDTLVILGACLVFLPADIETLATKMNGEPDNQALQEENQRLRQELNSLQYEIAGLKDKNAELKAEVDRLQGGNKGGEALLSYESENLRLVEWVINEFYHPDKFDINDPKTYPKQDYMIAEIMRVHGVTGVTAKAVERVATPFNRDKSKK